MKTLAAVSLCLAFACSTPRQATEPAAPSADAGYQQVLQSTDLDGKPVGAPAANVRATLVVFFASWCSHCRRELATIDELRREHPDLRIVGLNAYEEWSDMSDQQRLRAFLGENAPWLQVVRADSAMLKTFGGVPKIPTMFVFDAEGKLTRSFRRGKTPMPDKAQIAEAITAASARPDR